MRAGNAFRLHLNGIRLSPYKGSENFPGTGLPSDATKLRVGRRDRDQFYGLIDEVAIFTRAFDAFEIAAASTATLTGTEAGLLAGFRFDDTPAPPLLNRAVTLPTAADIPD